MIIEDNTLVSQQGLIFLKREEAPLKQVAQILLRQVETWAEDSDGKSQRVTNKVIYVIDTHGRTFYSFSAHLIGKKHIKRFEETVHATNPNTNIDLN